MVYVEVYRTSTMAAALRRPCCHLVCSRQVVQPIERVLASRSDIKVGLIDLRGNRQQRAALGR